MQRAGSGRLLAAAVLLLGAVAVAQQPAAPGQQATAAAPAAPRSATIDVVVLDSSNRPLTDLSPADFRVTVDGEPRAVIAVQYVVKGRGAVSAARSLSASTRLPVTAEASRLVVLAVDEDSIRPGAEKLVSAAVGRVIDNLAAADQVLLVSLPMVPRNLSASRDRGSLRDQLARIVGRADSEAATERASALMLPEPPVVQPDDELLRNRGNVEQPHEDRRIEPAERPVGDLQAGPISPLALAGVMDGMRSLPGPKTLVVFSGGERRAGEANKEIAARIGYTAAADRAVAARAVVHAVYVARASSPVRDRELERLAAMTGGRSVAVSGGARDLEALDSAMAGSYLLQIERRPDDERKVHGLRVTTARRGTSVLASARWIARNDPLPPPLPAEPTPAPAAFAPPVSGASLGVAVARGRPRPAPRNDPALNAVLARMSEYLETFIREFSNVVAEEVYQQHINLDRPNARNTEVRRLRSDLLLVQTSDRVGWVPFRDVFEVDGSRVRDREERLQKLFLEGSGDALRQGYRISEESARFNLGNIRRTVNVPTLALEFLLPPAIKGCNFQRRGEENVEGVRAWKIDFEEWASPTVIKTGEDGTVDYPAEGSIWVEPLTGRIVKTRVRAADSQVSMESTVLYRRNDVLGIWTPAEMREVYERSTGRIGGDAKYINFRRFQVTTEETVKLPKK